ncbi:hypothetical protein [Dokdonella sp.]|uniref:hypothetical protein n=1 Tax=Dokdonella sp. TaxID=2291710 RepID=UPI0035286F46
MRHRIAGLAVALLVGCLGLVVAAPALADGSAADALFQAHEKMLASRCVTESVTTSADGKESRSTIEFDTINRMRVVTDQMSFIILPEGTWMRSGDGQWTKPPIDMSAMFKRLVPSTIEEIRAGTSNVKDEGMQSVDGRELRAISYDVNTKIMGIAVSSRNTVYLDDSGRILRTVSDGSAMGHKTHTVQNIRYDDSIRVNPPG